MVRLSSSVLALLLLLHYSLVSGFQPSPGARRRDVALRALKIGKNYDPKWKKKLTIAEKLELENGGHKVTPEAVGLKGSINVLFKQGDTTKTIVAMPGQPIRELASNAGQFIQYGCGKGECGTCEAQCGGKWIRPCMATVPADLSDGSEYVILIKTQKNKSKSSGKFYSVKSFLMGFYNNLLGMFGFVRDRRIAKKNWNDRKQFDSDIIRLAAEKKAARKAAKEAKKE